MVANDRPPWAHGGILYRSKNEVRFFELRTHCDLKDEPIEGNPMRERIVWVEPKILPERALLVVARCKLVHKCHQEKAVPYGFRYARTAFGDNGSVVLGPEEVGLTCATIIDAVFASEHMPLVDPMSWPSPDDFDKKERRRVITDISKRGHREHAARLEVEIDAPRIRPEEIVAAAAIHPTVGTYDSLLDGAAAVTGQLGL